MKLPTVAHWIVKVAEPEPATAFGAMFPVIPFGKELADNCTVPAKPFSAAIEIEVVAVEPWTHVRLDASAAILKLGSVPVMTVTGIVNPRDR